MAEEEASTAAAVEEIAVDMAGEDAQEPLSEHADGAGAELSNGSEIDAANGNDVTVANKGRHGADAEPASSDPPATKKEDRRRTTGERDSKNERSERHHAGVFRPPVTS